MTMTGMSQKEYLKKYLSSGSDDKKKKKKKPKANPAVNRMKIVDDDIDISTMRPLDDTELELYDLQEDAPQIAGIIDERPEEVRNKEKFAPKKWRVVADENDAGVKIIDKSKSNHASIEEKNRIDIDVSPPRLDKDFFERQSVPYTRGEKSSDSDASPPRKHQKDQSCLPSGKDKIIDADESSLRRSRMKNLEYSRNKYDIDISPLRKSKRNDPKSVHSNAIKHKIDDVPPTKSKRSSFENVCKSSFSDNSDNSPPRRSKIQNSEESIKNRYICDSDESPPRKNKRDNSDPSQRKSQNYDSDESPPRKERLKHLGSFCKNENLHRAELKRDHRKDVSPSGRRYRGSPVRGRDHNEPTRLSRKSDSDESPPRKNHKRSFTPPYKGKKRHSESPLQKRDKRRMSRSPQYRNKKGIEGGEYSQEVSKKTDDSRFHQRDSFKYNSPSMHFEDSSLLPRNNDYNGKKRDWKNSSCQKRKESDKSLEQSKAISKNGTRKKTMDGRKAGLVGAGELKDEIADLRQKEKLVFETMDPTISGKGAAPVMRDRKTGKKRDLEEETRVQKEKDEKQAERDAKYMQWGKGLKQVSDQEQKLKEALHEMSKPLARYADDEDLDKFLREQEREGDPMLAYIKSKNKSEDEKVKFQYEGSYMPNRFGIRPGHRWDGVDRSNGYEKQWFEAQNSRKAVEEEAYKWSTSDM